MENMEEMDVMIYETRKMLNTIIEEKQNLLDEEVIATSQKLDIFLNKYNNLLKKKILK
ncbi:aspartyl-phosphate phosphatase Spo0E family protein [Clostridium saccharobutylicum]|uniref:Spo0E like sporulation regulatory protein n=1 Tax=Clostridium saccharobutylicum TaxID=169679 RepID=A0A1S8MQ88_CLOSA|nr:aspartyl-phosphate phosphatase Spo0E family protein [Clostridium saccharobutylicum]OOM06359.1 Spo0E like sporulation regulatory protein [Clostridium saccharobutylicum]